MESEKLKRRYYPALDGLRGIAILLVVFYHNFGFINYFFFGWLGVDLFFVLSGFLITDILLKTRDRPNYLRNFYIRRVLRIVPLYYLALILFLYIVPGLNFNKVNFSFYINNQEWFWTYLQNWLLISAHSSDNTTALHHFWSLAVEEQFYLLWPWLILAVKKPGYLLTIIFILLLFVIAGRTYMWLTQIKYFNYFGFYTFTRIDGLCIGSMLAVLQFINSAFLRKYSTAIIFGLAAINFAFYFFNHSHHFTFPYFAIAGYTTFAIMFAVLMYEAISQHNKFLNLILQSKPLVFFSKISYSLYVFHWPLYLIFFPYAEAIVNNTFTLSHTASRVIISAILTVFAILISLASYHFFEKRILRLKKAFT